MGAVLLARDTAGNGREVALKTLALEQSFRGTELAEARQCFRREAEAAARLRHADIVTVFDAGEDQGLAYIAMERLHGHDLQTHTQASTLLPLPILLRVVARVADALAYAHRQGVLHRDVKPANVMVDLDADCVKLTDFGIARFSAAERTRTGLLVGTPSYLSPEQLLGQRPDGRSDLYALGVTLFQLLCARLPHEDVSMAGLMRQVAGQPAPDLRTLRPELPAALATLVARMLEKAPERRPADGREVALELRQLADRIDPAAAP